MDDNERLTFVKDNRVRDYENYLNRFSILDDFLYECFVMHNIAMKLDDERRKERLDGISSIAIKRLNELPNNELNKYIDSLINENSTLEDMKKDWAFKAKSLKKIETFIEENSILDEKYTEELKHSTIYYPFDISIETGILNHIDTDYPNKYEHDLNSHRFYKNNKRLRRNLAILSILCNRNYALCNNDIEDYKSENSDLNEDFINLVTNNLKEVSYVVSRKGHRMPKELLTFI